MGGASRGRGPDTGVADGTRLTILTATTPAQRMFHASQTNERKESMCFQLRDAMRVGNIQFSDEFFTTTQTVREVKQVLEDELRNFCILVEVRAQRLANTMCGAEACSCLCAAGKNTVRKAEKDVLWQVRRPQRRSRHHPPARDYGHPDLLLAAALRPVPPDHQPSGRRRSDRMREERETRQTRETRETRRGDHETNDIKKDKTI